MKAVLLWLLVCGTIAVTGVSAIAQASGDSPLRPTAPDPQTDSPPVSAKPNARTDSSPAPVQRNPDLRVDSKPGASAGPMDLGPETPAFFDIGLDAGLPATGDEWVEHTARSGEVKHQRSESPVVALKQPPETTPLETGAAPEPRVEHFIPVEAPVVMTMPAEPAVVAAIQPPIPASIPQTPVPPPTTTMPLPPDPFLGQHPVTP